MILLEALLLLASLALLLPVIYLLGLTLLSGSLRTPEAGASSTRFDIIVPAHDEEAGIARTVRNLLALDYPRGRFRVIVVADNCRDQTAERARLAGADVLVREDAELRGKGYALAAAFARSLADRKATAVVVVDADTTVSANLLTAFEARLTRGAAAAQAHYGVANARDSWRTRLMAIAFGAFHIVRSRARERLGVSCGLRGNGMCFSHALLSEVPHRAFSLVEDLEYGVRLGERGHRVHYAHEAEVLGEMVSGEKASRSQRRRWEGGRLQMAREQGPALLLGALRARSGLLLDLAMDVLVPPLSMLAGPALAGLALSAWLARGADHPVLALPLFAFEVAALVLYVLRGWWLSGMGARGLLDLAAAPFYVAWKLKLAVLPAREQKGAWVRTSREGGPESPPPARP